ncbi:MAG: hypothetical protein OIF51_03675 [Cellvibrionaceae bacterium]|nr:hypothetical protein [Cellvibrionaceae bacterium]
MKRQSLALAISIALGLSSTSNAQQNNAQVAQEGISNTATVDQIVNS